MVSERQLFQIFSDHYGSSQNGMLIEVAKSLSVAALSDAAVNAVVKCFKRFEARKRRWFSEKRTTVNLEELVKSGSNDVLIEDVDLVAAPKKKFRKSLDNLNRTQENRRTELIWSEVNAVAEEENVDPSVVLGLLLTRCNDHKLKALGRKIIDGESVDPEVKEIPLITALTIYCDCNLGKDTYTKQRRLLKSIGCPIFPSWQKVRNLQASITPEIQNLPPPYQGIYFPFLKALEITTVRLFETGLEVQQIGGGADLKMKLKYGFDGSGSHAIYNQKNNADTNNMILTVFCALNIQSGDSLVWEEDSPNIANTQRPLILQLGKEGRDTLEAQSLLNTDIQSMTNEGFSAGEQKVMVNDVHTMFDRKAADIYLGCTGAYCDLCTKSKQQCVQHIKNREMFLIDRDVQTMHNIFDDLANEEGEITKQPRDYNTRQGQIHKPIPNHSVKSTQVLHGLLRTFDHFMKAIVHVKAGTLDWSEIPGSYNKLFVDNSKNALRSALEDSLHIKWDQPDPAGKGGTTTTGNMARLLLHTKRETVINELDAVWREKFSKWGQHLSVILRIVSSKCLVNVPLFKEFCLDLYFFIVDAFPWVSITGSLHKVLGHSWELIELNGGRGIGALDEAGMEGCHKVLRGIRTRLSRKISQQANLVDTIRRMWYTSDPLVNHERKKGWPFCKQCQIRGHSTRYCPTKKVQDVEKDDDVLFNSLILS